ncbi:MAG TPA: endolytic transglycosylase MltG, partial [Candidatus Fermentibacter sp.]|nr:endolytic transglycosylase MltG [Candidatus Fermentibacter sp.]
MPLDSLEAAAGDDSLLSELGLTSLEGFLFPETYEFADSLPARSVLARMVRTGLERRDSSWLARVEDLGLSGESAVVLASIVEREARIDGERPLVAGVFLNRLSAGM